MNDLISRQAAIDALKEHRSIFCDSTPETFSVLPYGEKCRVDEIDNAIATLANLPSAEPEREKGHWVVHRDWLDEGLCGYECPECGICCDFPTNFCGFCGKPMKMEEKV